MPSGTATIELTAQQSEAAAKIRTWFDDGGEQVFRLFGYAGTGKTTLARHLVDQLGVRDVLYAAFTGKAAYMLRRKGCVDARTIHSLIYLPAEKARQKLHDLIKQRDEETNPAKHDILTRQIKAEERKLDSPDWILRDVDDTGLTSAGLLVVDEVSMVGDAMAGDLLSYGVPTLVLGDPAQLPPVDGAGYFIHAKPDHLLTEIHRFALDSPITRLATAVRGSTPGDRAYGIADADGDCGRMDKIGVTDLFGYDQVLVGTNATRWSAIHLLRALRGLVGGMPVAGDRVMILANSSQAEVFNGQPFEVTESRDVAGRDDRVELDVTDEDGKQRTLTAWRAGFAGLEGEKQAKRDGRGNVVAATFGQAITVHKSQGSEWDRVLVVDESGVFANIEAKNAARARRTDATQAGHLAGQRWLYTAITRSATQVTIIPRIKGVLT